MKIKDKKYAHEKETAHLKNTQRQGDLFPHRKKIAKRLGGATIATGTVGMKFLIIKQNWKFIVPVLAFIILSLAAITGFSQQPLRSDEVWGPYYSAQSEVTPLSRRLGQRRGNDTRARLLHWNEIMLDANAIDHTPVPLPGVFAEQLGPGRTSRAMAIVHIAIFDAINAIVGDFRSYTGLSRVRERTSMDAAIAQAAHDTLVALYPSQRQSLDELLAEDLEEIDNGREKTRGIALGQRAAARILARRVNDGSQHAEPRIGIDYFPGDGPGVWRQDPVSLIPLALGAKWNQVRPFVLRSADQFRIPPPPALTSGRYTRAFNEVKRLGGTGITPTERTEEQTIIGIYWGYDGTPGLGTPPRLFNQIAVHIANQKRTNVVGLARLLALVNTAMADAGIACWESKYFYKFWRPVGGIREGSPGTSPTGRGDGNPNTIGDPTFLPLGAPASNATGPNFTPPFPAYASGHATFGAALFQILRNFYGTDRIAFTFVSDEFNGETRGNDGVIRPRIPRRFSRLSEAEEENGQSRIYLGIHWEFDKTEGIAQGRRVANFVFGNAFEPLYED